MALPGPRQVVWHTHHAAVTRRTRASILPVALALLFAGCASRTFVGGYPIGDRLCPSSDPADWWCEAAADFASTSLNTDVPGHAAVTATDAYQAAWVVPNGHIVLRKYGTTHADGIIVFRLADGSARAYWVGCGVGPGGPPTAAGAHCNLMSPEDVES